MLIAFSMSRKTLNSILRVWIMERQFAHCIKSRKTLINTNTLITRKFDGTRIQFVHACLSGTTTCDDISIRRFETVVCIIEMTLTAKSFLPVNTRRLMSWKEVCTVKWIWSKNTSGRRARGTRTIQAHTHRIRAGSCKSTYAEETRRLIRHDRTVLLISVRWRLVANSGLWKKVWVWRMNFTSDTWTLMIKACCDHREQHCWSQTLESKLCLSWENFTALHTLWSKLAFIENTFTNFDQSLLS